MTDGPGTGGESVATWVDQWDGAPLVAAGAPTLQVVDGMQYVTLGDPS